MILQALAEHYDRLVALDDGSDTAPRIARFGYSQQKISFAVVLEPDGSLVQIESRMQEGGGKRKPRPSERIVPGQAKPSGSGLNPCFLWDNPAYLLGHPADPKDPKKVARAAESFAALRERHLSLREAIDDPGFAAVCRFSGGVGPGPAPRNPRPREPRRPRLRRLPPERRATGRPPAAGGRRLLAGVAGGAGRRRREATTTGGFGHVPRHRPHRPARPAPRAQDQGRARRPILRWGDRLFQQLAYESQGFEQGFNAPTSEAAAFAYCTALNHLLGDERAASASATPPACCGRSRKLTRSLPRHRPRSTTSCFAANKSGYIDDSPTAHETRNAVSGFLHRLRRVCPRRSPRSLKSPGTASSSSASRPTPHGSASASSTAPPRGRSRSTSPPTSEGWRSSAAATTTGRSACRRCSGRPSGTQGRPAPPGGRPAPSGPHRHPLPAEPRPRLLSAPADPDRRPTPPSSATRSPTQPRSWCLA